MGSDETHFAHCPWMAMNSLRNLAATLNDMGNKIMVDEDIRLRALQPLDRMLSLQEEKT